MSKPYSLYVHIFPNGKKYVGITCQQPIKRRWASNGSGYKKCPKMWKAIQKYGWDNVEHIVLYENLPKSVAEMLEIKFIREFNTIEDGYNIEHGGNVKGTHSDETRKKISLGNKGKKKGPLSAEAKQKISDSQKGEKNYWYGKHLPEDIKIKHSEFMKGNQYNKGKHHTDEFKMKKSIQMHDKYKDGGNPRCKKVIAINTKNGFIKEYYSLRNASESVNCPLASFYKIVNNNKEYLGYEWRYAQ